MKKEENITSLPIPTGDYQTREKSHLRQPIQNDTTDCPANSAEIEGRLHADSVNAKSQQALKFQIDIRRELERRIFVKLNTRLRRLK